MLRAHAEYQSPACYVEPDGSQSITPEGAWVTWSVETIIFPTYVDSDEARRLKLNPAATQSASVEWTCRGFLDALCGMEQFEIFDEHLPEQGWQAYDVRCALRGMYGPIIQAVAEQIPGDAA